MEFRLAADAVLTLHLAFVALAAFGALLALRWRAVALVQLPAAAWAVFIELSGRICPLTSLENQLRRRAGASGYGGDFVEHYLLAILYPGGLTRDVQLALAALVLAVNVAVYAWIVYRLRAARLRGA